MKYLAMFEKNWADEFDATGFSIWDEQTYEKYQEYVKKYKNNSYDELCVYFGTNEGWDDVLIKDILNAIDVKLISDEEEKIFNKYFSNIDELGYGLICPTEIIENIEEYIENPDDFYE